jgi:leucyl aminopeptidase (aminopeptidase T)
MKGAHKVIRTCACVRKGEKVLIVTDPGIDPLVSVALLEACKAAGSEGIVAIIAPRELATDPPPARVVDLMLKSDVILCPTSVTMFYTEAKNRACRRGARFLSMTEATLDVMSSGAIEADFKKQRPLVERLTKRLTDANQISLRTSAGTSVTASLESREALAITGICDRPGDSNGAPDIETYIAPVEDSVNGTALIDCSISGLGLVSTPVRIEVRDGMATKITGGAEARILRKRLADQNDQRVYQVAEIGIGLNPKAKLRGAAVEDESKLGTAHLALGDNSRIGGRNSAPTHIDLVFKKPTIRLDGKLIMLQARWTG